MSPQGRLIDPNDPTTLALALEALRGEQALLQREVASNINNLTSGMHALQGDVRHLTEQVSEVTRLQQQAVSHSEGLNRAFLAIEKLTARIDGWIDKHETENRTVADTVTDFRGRIRGVWMAGGLVVFLGSTIVTLAWNRVNERFAELIAVQADAKAERAALEARVRQAHTDDVLRMQRQMDETRARVEALEKTEHAR